MCLGQIPDSFGLECLPRKSIDSRIHTVRLGSGRETLRTTVGVQRELPGAVARNGNCRWVVAREKQRHASPWPILGRLLTASFPEMAGC
jgi:hypothetical protein